MRAGFERRAGFTLVEVIVSVAVISVLLTLSAPALRQTRESARRVQCFSNLRAFGLGVQMYREDHGGSLPHAAWFYHLPAGHTAPIDALIGYMDGAAAPRLDEDGYIISEAPFRCPSDPGLADEIGMSYYYGAMSPRLSDNPPEVDAKDATKVFEYGLDSAVLNDGGDWHMTVDGDPWTRRNALKMSGSVGPIRGWERRLR